MLINSKFHGLFDHEKYILHRSTSNICSDTFKFMYVPKLWYHALMIWFFVLYKLCYNI